MRELKLFDEQKIKKMKKAAAVGAVFVTLGCGVAEALPSGGQVVAGSVSVGGTLTTERGYINDMSAAGTASVGTITVTGGPAIINWTSFTTSNGNQTLSIDTSQGALLNRVLYNEATITDGCQLKQIGSNPCWIVAEQGISVAGSVSGTNLVLSVIPISDAEFIAVADGSKSFEVVGSPREITRPYAGSFTPKVVGCSRGEESTGVAGVVQLADGIVIEMPGGEFKFTDTGIPAPVQAALEFVSGEADKLTDITNANKVLEGNAMPAASEPAKDSAAVEAVIEEPMGGIGQITGNSFILGADTSAEDENVSYVAVGDVGNLVAINVWNNDGTSPSEAGANDGTAAGNANGGVDTNGRRSRLQ